MAEFIAFCMSKIRTGLSRFSFVKETKEKLTLLNFVHCSKCKIHSLMLGILMSQNQTSGSAEFAFKKLRILRTLKFKFYSA